LAGVNRRHSSDTGAAAAAAAAAGQPVSDLTRAPPLSKEPVGRDEAVGLLQAALRKRKAG
jgi:hypothetical protein